MFKLSFLVVSAACVSACGGEKAAPQSAASSAAPSTTQPSAAPPSATASASLPAQPAVSATASAVVSAAASASAAVEPAAPLPAVTVKNIGMHIGGGPNDDVTKGPIKRSVAPHFDALKACFAKAEDQAKGGDVSIDLRIDKAGGKAEIKKWKSAIAGEGFEQCVREVILGVDFEKPKTGTTVVSYSLRFTPDKKKS